MTGMEGGSALTQGREAYAKRAWLEAYESLSAAERHVALEAPDAELLATCVFMLGRDEESVAWLERAHQQHLERRDSLRAVHCAVWIGLNLASRGQIGPATGWLGRAQRLLENEGECAERGYLLLPVMFQHEAAGDFAAAAEAAEQAARIGERFGDPDLFALAIHGQGHMLIKDGRVREGLALLDEAMVAVTAEELSPIVAGLVYCGVILACQEVYEVRRAREWTTALSRLVRRAAGHGRVHRPLPRAPGRDHAAATAPGRTRWRRRGGPASASPRRESGGRPGLYRQGELHRLQGEFAAAEEAYREASRLGWEPQPGLALLRLAQGRREAARGGDPPGARRDHGAARSGRALLPAYVEIMLAAGDVEARARPARELEELARELRERDAGGDGRPRAGRGRAGARATPQAALVALRGARRAGRSSRRRTRGARRACSSARPAARSATRDAARWSWRPRGSSSGSSAPRRISRASKRAAGRAPRTD